ncbi:hypothetical protein [Bradyrhizobium sp. USDA 3364]
MDLGLFDFWKEVSPSAKVHPQDRSILEADDAHSFDLKCLPIPYYGPLRTAPIVLLYLNPGLSAEDRADASSEDARLFWWRQRQGSEALRSQIHREKRSWWVSRTKCFGVDPEVLRHKLAVLELCAYHSKAFTDGPLLERLPSSKTVRQWAASNLFPQARLKKRVVICLRSARRWGLTVGSQDGWFFAPFVTRSGYMFKDGSRADVIEAVKQILRSN